MFNLLSTVIDTMPVFDNPYNLNFIGKFIQWLLESLPNMGLGIIIFTLALKLLTLPLDIYSRVSMKKNNLKMERMRPQLEKLQRQYANNKELYNQKIAALYKKEGYSALSSCLPTLVTLIVFIIVINQFSNYSDFSNLQLIQGMATSYNDAVISYTDDSLGENANNVVYKVGNEYYFNESVIFSDAKLSEIGVLKITDENGNTSYKAEDIQKFYNYVKELNGQGYEGVKADTDIIFNSETNAYEFSTANFEEDTPVDYINGVVTEKVISYECEAKILNIKNAAREAAASYYRENVPSFLWVKNIWVEDLPWKHPVKESFSGYKFSIRQGCKSVDAGINMEDTSFEELTYNLRAEKEMPNGYLILVVLSIGVMILSTVISNKTQKAQMELQSVDGTAAQTSKMMMWMMPVMFGVFAFIYTASFSIYMVVSSVISTVSTVVINKLVEKSFNKKIEEENLKNDKRFRKSK